MSKNAAAFRRMLNEPGLIVAPGASDPVTARLVAKHGFKAIYMTGAGASAMRIGMPDTGLMTSVEMIDHAQNIATASGLPLISDADDGYGGVLNVQRTVRGYERAGVAAIHIEDQQWPKRCGHLSGKTLIPTDEMAAKIRAACDAREDPDFTIIARTDALAVEGFEAALDRGRAYEEAGADAIFIESPTAMDQIARIPKVLTKPALFNMASSGKTPFLHQSEIEALGYKIVIYPIFTLLSAVTAISATLAELKEKGTVKDIVGRIATFQEFFTLMGLKDVQEKEARYGVAEAKRARF